MYVEHRLELLVGHLLDGRVPSVTGIVDDDVEPAQLLDGRPHEAFGETGLRHVAIDRDRLAADRLDLINHRLARRIVESLTRPSRHDGRVSARCAADTAPRAGYQGDFSCQIVHFDFLIQSATTLRRKA